MITWESVLFPDPLGPMMACTSPERIVRSIPLRISLPVTPARRPLISSTCSSIADHHLGLAVDDAHLVDRHRLRGGQGAGLAVLEGEGAAVLPALELALGAQHLAVGQGDVLVRAAVADGVDVVVYAH